MDRDKHLLEIFTKMKMHLIYSGHKMFDTSRAKFRTCPTLLAARPLAYKQKFSVFVLRYFHNKIEYGWLMPHGGDTEILRIFRTDFSKKDVRENARLFSYIREESTDRLTGLVQKKQRDEFLLFIQSARP